MPVSGIQALSFGGVGVRLVTTSAEALPDQDGSKLVYLRAHPANTGYIYVGPSTVTNTITADNATTGFVLGPGQDSPPIPVPPGGNDQVYVIASAADQVVTFMWYK